mgnify:CR=1 FL=1
MLGIVKHSETEKAERFKIFSDENLGSVRTLIVDDQIWFCAKDSCGILGIKNHKQALSRLEKDEVGMFHTPHPQSRSKLIKMNYVSESGLYSLIFGSTRPEAKTFKKWITKEVIPSIRRTGAYDIENSAALPQMTKKQQLLVGIVLAENETARAMALSRYNEEYVKPIERESQKYREFLDKNGTLTSKQIAGRMGTSAEFLNRIMNYVGIIVRNGSNWMPQKKYGGTGIMKLVENTFIIDGKEITNLIHRWTPEGADLCEKVLIENNAVTKDVNGKFKENTEIASLIRSAHKMFRETGKRTYRLRGTVITGLKFLTEGK